jgi:hypothetical protein
LVSSSGFFASVDDLFADILKKSGEKDIAKVLCTSKGGTDYTMALNGAATVIGTASEDAVKEIYFISDGVPEPDSHNGVAEAATLKANGVTIAGLMLNGSDKYLENDISSRDPNGVPLYAKVNNASQLSKALLDLTSNDIEKGQLRYRVISGKKWETVDIMAYKEELIYELPSFKLGKDAAPEGLDVVYEYWDRRGTHYTEQGTLNWKTGE